MSIYAWHFVGDKLRDSRAVPKNGEWLIHPATPVLCESGLHASEHPFDALKYAPGPNLCRVECDGEIIRGGDKIACTKRRIVARMDATEMLRYFARMQAVSVVHLWNASNIVLDYLMTGDGRLRDAAWDAAWAAPRAAAMDAAWAAAWAAARDAAREDFRALVHECFGVDGGGKND